MNEPVRSRFVAAVLLVGIVVVAVVGLWALVVAAASLQGGYTNTTIVPLLGAVLLGAVALIGLIWLVRLAASSRRRPPPSGAAPREDEATGR